MHARLIQYSFSNQAENLAAEESVALAVQAGETPPTVLIWQNSNAVVLGKFQCWRNEVFLDACQRYSTIILRRFSGGGAVFQDLGNLNISFIFPLEKGKPLITGFRIQKQINKVLKATVDSFGVQTVALPHGGLEVKGRKVSGAAGVIKTGLVFSHYTLLISADIKKLNEVLTPMKADKKGCVKSRPSPVANLSDFIDNPVRDGDLIYSLKDQLQLQMGIKATQSSWAPFEINSRVELTDNKHSTNEWIFWR
ncbi:MAG: biotin/lipoate A/B protein ligase family protein [Candidatus Heimdallarchaeota archaeon]